MSAVAAGIAGAALGAGVWMLARARRRPSLAELLNPSTPRQPAAAHGGPAARLGSKGAAWLARLGLPRHRLRADLALCDSSTEAYLAEKATAVAAAIAVPVVLAGLDTALGAGLAPPTLLAVSAGCAGACWMAPDLAVRTQARRRRAELRTATSVLADLSVIALAGGAGVAGALTQAARPGRGWACEQIRTALHTSAVRQQPAWSALAHLADTTGVAELGELAASLQLAGADGARVRASIASKATALRTAERAAAEARTAARTERMTLPVTVLVLGFMVLIGYPALVHVVTGF
ncbi:type II secretion system F family protein [Streptomonospora salina]|uniref:Type II secretion system protein GspF domain-containing protein n=1 Tax=Streptomonospora salina TaxID=104205 RepID=A0A841EG93_9ACTN|nr:type II secretion system F family protein [Streptomonospora salina]MBB5998441.1 hypothetical protein [Streptomonospora salina]